MWLAALILIALAVALSFIYGADSYKNFQMLTAPMEFHLDGKGWPTAARCAHMELGEPDSSGRRRPVPKQGSEFDLPLSLAIIAIGPSANQIVLSATPGLGTNQRVYQASAIVVSAWVRDGARFETLPL